MSELKEKFYNINDLCDSIKKDIVGIKDNASDIDKLGKNIDMQKYVELLGEIATATKKLQMFNVEQFKK